MSYLQMNLTHPGRRPQHSTGRGVLHALGQDAVFSELSSTYPLKLLSPKINSKIPVGVAYILSYGGGLISDDVVNLSFDVGENAILLLLTQGSTKVFPARTQNRERESSAHLSPLRMNSRATTQNLSVNVAAGACLIHLPDPVTCFSGAIYSQQQKFVLETSTSSLCILDWYTSGRMTRGEEWLFERYRSVNEVWRCGKRLARDVLLLEEPPAWTKRPFSRRTLKDRLAPYSCYATVLFFGPATLTTVSSLQSSVGSIVQYRQTKPADFIWSFSPVEGGGILRAAAKETETIKDWLKLILKDLIQIIGPEAYDKTFI